jgi:carbon storage regulator
MRHAILPTLAIVLAVLCTAPHQSATTTARPPVARADQLPRAAAVLLGPVRAVPVLRVCPCNYRTSPPIPCTCPGGECQCGAWCWCAFPGPRCTLVSASCCCPLPCGEMCDCPDCGCPCGCNCLCENCSGKETPLLVLSRKLGEKIVINGNIILTVVDIDRGKIRLGIEAPREVPIMREELLRQIPAGTAALPQK